MKPIAVSVVFLAFALLLVSGCTSQPAQPAATTATMVPPPATPAAPPDLCQSWTLIKMGIQDGRAVLNPTGTVTLVIKPDGTLYGYTGCNNYNAAYTLTGTTTPKGQGITVGPVEYTTKYCAPLADQERTYIAILQDSAAYAVNVDKLTITAEDGNALVFQMSDLVPTPAYAPGF